MIRIGYLVQVYCSFWMIAIRFEGLEGLVGFYYLVTWKCFVYVLYYMFIIFSYSEIKVVNTI